MDELEYPDESADPSPAQDEQDDPANASEGEASPEGTEEEDGIPQPYHKDPRWQKVYGELKGYKSLGATPDQILELARELQYYRSQDARNRQEQRQESRPPTDDERQTATQLKAARAALERVAPELNEVGQLKQILTMLGHQAQLHRESLDTQAHNALAKVMTQAGLQVDEQKLNATAHWMIPLIQNNEHLLQMYFRDPAGAVTSAWELFTKDVDYIASRQKGARLQQKGVSLSLLPRAQQGGGGAAPTRGQKPAQNLDELFRRERGTLTGKE